MNRLNESALIVSKRLIIVKHKSLLLVVVICVLGVGGWFMVSPKPVGDRLAIAAASDLRYALDALTAQFSQLRPETAVSVSYGSSGNFFAQLSNGAPFDVFLSADITYPQRLVALGLADAASEFVYAEGRLVIWVPAGSAVDVERLGLRATLDPAVARVAVANPEHAPYGRAAVAALRGAGVFSAVKPRLVLGENVSQAFQFVQSGAADLGIVALSLVRAPVVREAGRYWVVPAEAHPRLEQGGVIMRSAVHPEVAARFRAFMIGDAGRDLLADYGFIVAAAQSGLPSEP